jgi:membrane protein implicated in regulation of membrane protease activity
LHYFFQAVFLLGLILAVAAMLFGVERRATRVVPVPGEPVHASGGRVPVRQGSAPPSPRARWNLPLWAAFCTVFGATGYLLTRNTTLGLGPRILIATAVGGAAVFGVIALIAKWAIPSAKRDPEDPRYVLQGHPARVARAISTAVPGEIAYEVDGTRYAAKARSIDGQPMEAGAEVVIERVEDGVAWVEPWSAVEQRI